MLPRMMVPAPRNRSLATTIAAWLSLVATLGCGDPPEYPVLDAPIARDLELLVADLEAGTINRDEFRAAVNAIDAPPMPGQLERDFATTTLLPARAEPYVVNRKINVLEGAILVIQEGAALRLGPEVEFFVQGRLYAIGSQDQPIRFFGERGQNYEELRLESGPNQLAWVEFDRGTRNLKTTHPVDTTTLVDSARFDSWSYLAVAQLDSSGLRIVNSEFGYETPEEEVAGETIQTVDSGAIIIENSRFNYRRGYRDVLDIHTCKPGYWSVIAHNRFDGGEDDAIDLDGCNALVIGNLIRNFRPEDLSAMAGGVNGGGVTGDAGAMPVIVNNVIDNCYHGIGFKNGSRPIIINNTITNSNIGVSLYTSAVGRAMPHGVMVNNILWNNLGWLDGGQDNDIVLNGKWWPSYNQVDDIQATVDVRYNTIASSPDVYPGEGNLGTDPLLDFTEDIPVPAAGSPVIDSGLSESAGFGLEALPAAERDAVLQLLTSDYLGTPRTRDGDDFPGIDRGAVERP